jgi:CRP-like cAMP-binding protein
MTIAADRKDYTTFLEGIPAFSSCSRSELEEFAHHSVVTLRSAAGEVLSSALDQGYNLYVLVSGTALLHADDGVAVRMEPGDYFGKCPARCHHMTPSVVATSDVELLVINTHEAARFGQASAAQHAQVKSSRHITFPSLSRRTPARPGMASLHV